MIGFKQYLAELLDRPAKYNISTDNYLTLSAEFELDDVEYNVMITSDTRFTGYTEEGFYEIYFTANVEETTTVDITNTGNAPIVFATVAKILRHHWSKYKNHVNKYVFSAKEASRVKLYARLAKMLKRELGMSKVTTGTKYGNTTVFYIEK